MSLTIDELGRVLVQWTVGFAFIYGVIWKVAPRLSKIEERYRATFADNLFNIPFLPVLCYTAIVGSASLGASVESRWAETTPESTAFLIMYMSKNIMRSVSSIALGDSKPGIWLIHIHHIVSVICFGSGLILGRLHFFGVLDGVCEVSVIFLNFKLLWRDFALKQNYIYVINLHILAFTWFLTRIILFPIWIFIYLYDTYYYPEISIESVSRMEYFIYPITTLAIWAMSVKWFVPLMKEVKRTWTGNSYGDCNRNSYGNSNGSSNGLKNGKEN
ncbi:hypothetical protein AAMO2058_000625500 [Amorphochlora amoebiformis]